MPKINVLIVEDEVLIAEDIRDHLTNVDYEVGAVVHNKADALEALQVVDLDFAILDINLEGSEEGIEIAEIINSRHKIPFIYLTSYSTKDIIDKAKHTRPWGYVVKPFDEADLYSSIEIALYNFSQISQPNFFSQELINEQLSNKLTDKEFEVVRDIYMGSTNKQLAEKHFVSLNTVKTHVQNIYLKLGTNSRATTIAKLRNALAT